MGHNCRCFHGDFTRFLRKSNHGKPVNSCFITLHLGCQSDEKISKVTTKLKNNNAQYCHGETCNKKISTRGWRMGGGGGLGWGRKHFHDVMKWTYLLNKIKWMIYKLLWQSFIWFPIFICNISMLLKNYSSKHHGKMIFVLTIL